MFYSGERNEVTLPNIYTASITVVRSIGKVGRPVAERRRRASFCPAWLGLLTYGNDSHQQRWDSRFLRSADNYMPLSGRNSLESGMQSCVPNLFLVAVVIIWGHFVFAVFRPNFFLLFLSLGCVTPFFFSVDDFPTTFSIFMTLCLFVILSV